MSLYVDARDQSEIDFAEILDDLNDNPNTVNILLWSPYDSTRTRNHPPRVAVHLKLMEDMTKHLFLLRLWTPDGQVSCMAFSTMVLTRL